MAASTDTSRSLSGAVWDIAPRAAGALFAEFADEPELTPLAVQVLHNRGYDDAAKIREFLLGPPPPYDPYLLAEMELAVERLGQAAQRRERVCVYSDYDLDGVSAAALLLHAGTALGLDVFPYIPNRAVEGYGLHAAAVDTIADEGARLIVSADCGGSAEAEIAHAAARGVDVVVTDHHPSAARPTRAAAVLNPNGPAGGYPFRGLAGVGVAYKLVQALAEECPQQLPDPEAWLDLAALGTIADVAPLRDENRHLVAEGLAVMRAAPRPGLRALAALVKRPIESISAEAVAFSLAPRLNAAGRMANAQLALELLLCTHPVRAEELAGELDQLNAERRRLTADAVEAARAQVGAGPLVFATSAAFALGVVGLAASHLCGELGAPAFVGAEVDGLIRGSARAPEGFDLTQLFDRHAALLEHWGGHPRAAGFSLRRGNAEALRQALADDLAGLAPAAPRLSADGRVYPRTITWETWRALDALAPWGEAHAHPRLVVENVRVRDPRVVGQNHLAMRFEELADSVRAIWFGGGSHADALHPGRRVDVAFRLQLDDYRGETRLQMFVDDVRLRTA